MRNKADKIPATNTNGVAGLFKDESKAEKAVDELKSAGFSEREIGIATAHQEEGQIGKFWDDITNKFGKHEHTEHAEELNETLCDSGVPEQQARYFNSVLGKGGVLITVRADPARAPQAMSILQRNEADVGAGAAEWERSQSASDKITAGQRIQLVGEVLRVHKERISRGEVRLRKEVVTQKQQIEVPVTREELVIERLPGEGREAGAEIGSGQKEIRVPLTEERVQVEKKPVLNEEIRVGKRQVQESKRVSGEVRHEELRTETEGDAETEKQLKEKTRRTA
jgi:uncharacterized protein (TIGR02271 family)